MKKAIILAIALLITSISTAQTGFNYKALLTDNGNVIDNQLVTIRFTVLENGTTSVYQETRTATTDANGIVKVVLGEGVPVSGSFITINWANPQSLKVEIDTGSGYQDFGTNPLKYVPTAKYADKADDVNKIKGIPISSTAPSNGQVLKFNGTEYVPASDDVSGGSGTDGVINSASFSGTTSKTLTITRTNGLSNITANFTDNVNDADHSTTNEIQTISKSGSTVTLSNGGGSFTDADTDTHLSEAQVDAYVSNNGYLTSEVDGSTTNEIQHISKSGNTVTLSNGGGSFTDADTHLTETQVDNFVSNNGYLTTATLPDQTDADFYEVGTTTPADAIDDGIFRTGRMAVGKNTLNDGLQNKNAQFEIYSSGYQSSALLYLNEENNVGAGLQSGIFMENEYNGTFGFIAIRNRITGTGTGYVKGLYQNISGNTEGGHTGIFNYMQGTGTGNKTGVYNTLSAGGNEITGTKTEITSYTDGLHFGNYNKIDNSGGGNHFGMFNTIEGAGIGEQYGVVNTISNSGNNSHFGTVNDLSGTGSGEHKGTFNYLTGDGTGIQYGTYTSIDNTKDQEHYGAYNLLTGGGSGHHTGIKNDLSGNGTGVFGGVSNTISGSATTMQYGVTNTITGTSTSEQYGTINQINNSGNNKHYGTYNLLNGSGTGIHYGTYNWLTGSGTGLKHGVFNLMEGNSTGYGVFNDIKNRSTGIYNKLHDYSGTGGTVAIETENTNSNSGDNYGITNKLFGSGTGKLVGTFNSIDNTGYASGKDHIGVLNSINGSGGDKHIGVQNSLWGSSNRVQIAVNNEISNSGNQVHYGIKNNLTGTGSGDKYGIYSQIPTTAGGTHYAIFGEALKSGSYAGYFWGNVYVDTGSFTVYNPSGNASSVFESSAADVTVYIKSHGNNNPDIHFYNNSAFKTSMGYSVSKDAFFIYQDGNVYFKDGDILPTGHKLHDLGANGNAWDNVYADNYINQGAAAFTDRSVTEELLLHKPVAKKDGDFDAKTPKGLYELNPASLPDALHIDNALLIDEMASYNYKANYEQQQQIEKLKKEIERLKQENNKLKALEKRLEKLEKLLDK